MTAVLCTLMLGATPQTGVRLDLDTVDPRGASGEQRLELQGDKLRVDHLAQEATGSGGVNRAPQTTMIFDGRVMFAVNHWSKTYTVIHEPQAKGQLLGKVDFKKGSGKDRVAGFTCTNYSEMRNSVEQATVCLASWKAGPVKSEDLAGLLKFAAIIGAAEASAKAVLVDPGDWPGFPVSSQSNDGQIVRLKSVARTTIPEIEFEPPVGYTRMSSP